MRGEDIVPIAVIVIFFTAIFCGVVCACVLNNVPQKTWNFFRCDCCEKMCKCCKVLQVFNTHNDPRNSLIISGVDMKQQTGLRWSILTPSHNVKMLHLSPVQCEEDDQDTNKYRHCQNILEATFSI